MPSLPPSNAFKGSSGWCCRMNVASIQPPDEKMLGGTSNTPRSRSPSARRDLGFMGPLELQLGVGELAASAAGGVAVEVNDAEVEVFEELDDLVAVEFRTGPGGGEAVRECFHLLEVLIIERERGVCACDEMSLAFHRDFGGHGDALGAGLDLLGRHLDEVTETPEVQRADDRFREKRFASVVDAGLIGVAVEQALGADETLVDR